jgi:aldehyde dehydrogenase (NAD+)
MTMIEKREFYIDGKWVAPTVPNDFNVINPATEKQVATISLGSKADVDKAVAAAKKAFDTFSQTSKEERLALLKQILEVYKKRQGEVAEAIKLELGAPHKLAHGPQAGVGVGHLEGFIDALERFEFETKEPNGDLIFKEPIGVCGLITPWNWPINQIALKVLPAIATGCTVVLKPSEITPLNAILYAEILDEAGVPAGVFNLVNGDGLNVGAALSQHPDVAMMSFTGSTRAGIAVSKDAAENVKKVTLELGGKSPNIIFDEEGALDVVKRETRRVFSNSGQSCNARTRILVERSIYNEAMKVAADAANGQKVGDPNEEGHHIGPLVSQLQFDRVQALIQAGIDEGATLLAGGTGRPENVKSGFYVKPTVFGNVNNNMRIAREEVFGPVVALIPFDTEEEAIAIANDTEYGLAAAVQTNDPEKAMRIARKLRAGMVHINNSDIGYGTPFGGYKMSGTGREGGHYGLEDFLEIKAVSVPA